MKALVTGASGGIGLEIVKILASEGYDLALVARNGEELNRISAELIGKYSIQVECVPCDLTADGSVEHVYNTVGEVDVLVNNAGFGDYGRFIDRDLSKQDSMIELNIRVLTDMTHVFAKGMVERRKGKILNIASVASFQTGPLMSVYYASKAYVLSFSEAIATELKGTGVTVTAVCPGPVETGFAKRADAEVATVFKKGTGADPADVARFAVKAMDRGKVVAVHGVLFKFAVWWNRLLPRCVVRRIVLWVQSRRSGL